MRYKDKKEARIVNDPILTRPNGVSDEQWNRALDLYEVARKKGDKFPELTVAQAALETGWFKQMSGNYNYFGQKAGKSQQGSVKVTKEFENNKAMNTVAKFRDYDSLDNAMEDRLAKWGKKYEDAKTVNDAIGKIWKYDPETGKGTGYATDINYDRKLTTILGMMGVDTNEEVKPDNFSQRNTTARNKILKENQVQIDNTATNVKPVKDVLQPLVTNQVDTVTEGNSEVEKARDKIEKEENKFQFTQMLMNAGRVEFIADITTPPQELKDGGTMQPNRKKFMDEIARLYMNKDSKIKNELDFSEVAGKKVNKTRMA